MKSTIVNTFLILLSILFVTTVLEFAYRKQLVDFYYNEYNSLNPNQESKTNRVLVFGDSFSAHPKGYVRQLRDSLPDTEWINAAISGTGLQEVSYIFNRRYSQAKPDLVLFQIYPANDLSDIWQVWIKDSISTFRQIYWTFSNNLHFLRYANYKLSVLRQDNSPLADEGVKNWNLTNRKIARTRTEMRIHSYPSIIRESLHLENQWADETSTAYFKTLESLLDQISPEVKVIILVIPHCSQVSDVYYQDYLQLGADLPSRQTHFAENYPFIERLKKVIVSNRQVVLLNPLPTFQQVEEKGIRLFYPGDIHLNDNGNEVLTAELLKWLNQNEFN